MIQGRNHNSSRPAACLALAALTAEVLTAAVPVSAGTTTFRDDFNGLSPVWNVRDSGCNSKNNVSVSNGVLHLKMSFPTKLGCYATGARVDTFKAAGSGKGRLFPS